MTEEVIKQRYLNTRQAAEYLGVSAATVYRWRVVGKGPVYSQGFRKVFYDPADLDKWMNENKQSFIGEIKEG